jgi:hypothetical protein
VGPATVVRWGALFAGALVGVAMLVTLMSLWRAIGIDSEVDWVRDNVEWFGFASAVFALFVAGLLSGWLSTVNGPGSGLLQGLAVWGLILAGSIVFDLPEGLRFFQLGAAPFQQETRFDLWATFGSYAGGLVTAVMGGAIGASLPRAGLATDLFERRATGTAPPPVQP